VTLKKKIAIVLFNLGGPNSLKAVRPFLFNLFSDKAILRFPQPFRYLLAKFISTSRTQKAIKIYEQMGGKSPLLENTIAQQMALEESLGDQNDEYRIFISMRYWHPLTEDASQKVKDYGPDEIILLPLYPHYSTTTTESSFKEWYRLAKRFGIAAQTRQIDCYPVDDLFIGAHAETIAPFYKKAATYGKVRILFSAHSLPQKIIDAGDPYQQQTTQTVQAIIKKLGGEIDHVICYQSRVGPIKWLEPTTEAEIERAARDKVSLVVVPISFVSEHSETLVELDKDYRHLAEKLGIPFYGRVPALSNHPLFIDCLKRLICGQ